MKEISEINKKINLTGGGGVAVAARPGERPIPPGMVRGAPGLGLVNELAPHLRPG